MDIKGSNVLMEAISFGEEVRRFVRIHVIGKEGVGKSCLVRRLLGQKTDDIKSTDGIDILRKCQIRTVDGKWIIGKVIDYDITEKISQEMEAIFSEVEKEKDKRDSEGLVECGIWDFAGQKDYYVTHQTFLTPHAIYLLVVNLKEDIHDIKARTNDENFDSIGVEERKLIYLAQFQRIIETKKSNHKRSVIFLSNTKSCEGDIDKLREKISEIAEEMAYFEEKLPLGGFN
ncbi:unnamed protein product [Mytilus edulis]|uniref:Uncharacterized protein n=1 Tax=Mytilus edulis TaxID=6550 RepID=A0A8S3Q6I2_MYTED|nr:unnamed protein product [Mytilus edulis]